MVVGFPPKHDGSDNVHPADRFLAVLSGQQPCSAAATGEGRWLVGLGASLSRGSD